MMKFRALSLAMIVASFLAVRLDAVTVEINSSGPRNDNLDRSLLPQASNSGDIQTWSQNNNSNLDSALAMQIQNWAANHNFDLSSLNLADVQNHQDSNSGNDNSGGSNDGNHSGDDNSGGSNLVSDDGDHHSGDDGSGDSHFGSQNGDHEGDDGEDEDENHTPQAVPEPGTIASLASGALLLGGYLLRRRK